MKRVVSVLGGAVFAAAMLSLALAPVLSESNAAAAPTPPATATADAGPLMSPYLLMGASGTVLPPSLGDVEAFCALALGCRDVPLFPPAPDFQGCVRELQISLSDPAALNASLTIRQCGLSATSCAGLRKCALKDADSKICDGIALESKEPIGKCDVGGRAVTCWRGRVLGVRNCELADELCVAKEGKAECSLPGACPATVKADWSCAGTRMVKCLDGKFLSIDCHVLNLTCVMGPDAAGKTVAGCAPIGGVACKAGGKYSCSGTDAIGCVLGKAVKVACGSQGMSCADPTKPSTDRTSGVCEMPAGGTPCDSKSFEAKCDATSIKYCAFGQVRSYPCKSIGANKCVTDKGTGPRCTG